jgi:hypothetical protein
MPPFPTSRQTHSRSFPGSLFSGPGCVALCCVAPSPMPHECTSFIAKRSYLHSNCSSNSCSSSCPACSCPACSSSFSCPCFSCVICRPLFFLLAFLPLRTAILPCACLMRETCQEASPFHCHHKNPLLCRRQMNRQFPLPEGQYPLPEGQYPWPEGGSFIFIKVLYVVWLEGWGDGIWEEEG